MLPASSHDSSLCACARSEEGLKYDVSSMGQHNRSAESQERLLPEYPSSDDGGYAPGKEKNVRAEMIDYRVFLGP